jgi:hypothetical protein
MVNDHPASRPNRRTQWPRLQVFSIRDCDWRESVTRLEACPSAQCDDLVNPLLGKLQDQFAFDEHGEDLASHS